MAKAAKAKVIFDRSRPYGEIYGEFGGTVAKYEQGGFYFTEAGELVTELLTPAQKQRIEAAEGKAINPETPKPNEGVDIDNLNLTAWVKGEIEYPLPSVREAVKKRYSINLPGPADIAEYLAMEAGICSVDEIAPKHRADQRGLLKAA